jgi:hypothetical protein
MTFQESPKADLQRTGNNSISKVKANLSATGKVKVTLDLFEGNDRPNVAFILSDADGNVIARSFIISCIEQHMDFTLHIQQDQPIFPLILICETFFEENLPVDEKKIIIQQ